MNTQILTIIKTRHTKAGIKYIHHKHREIIYFNYRFHAQRPCKSLICDYKSKYLSHNFLLWPYSTIDYISYLITLHNSLYQVKLTIYFILMHPLWKIYSKPTQNRLEKVHKSDTSRNRVRIAFNSIRFHSFEMPYQKFA